MRFLSRYPGLFSRNAIWNLFYVSKPAWSPRFNNAYIGLMQTRQMAYAVPPPFPPSASHLSSDKSFQDIILHFHDLFRTTPPDLAERLMSTITSNPGTNCVIGLAWTLYNAESLDASIRSVVQVLPRTTDIMVMNDIDFDKGLGTFREMLKASITYMLWRELINPLSEQITDATTYRVLYAALFSASAVKNGLLDADKTGLNADFIYVFTRFGLLLADSESPENDRKKVAVIRAGACLQLITTGSVFMEKHFAETTSLADIKAALDALITVLERLRIEHPRGQELLQKTLEAAKSNFANPLSASDAWKILFPTDSYFGGFGG